MGPLFVWSEAVGRLWEMLGDPADALRATGTDNRAAEPPGPAQRHAQHLNKKTAPSNPTWRPSYNPDIDDHNDQINESKNGRHRCLSRLSDDTSVCLADRLGTVFTSTILVTVVSLR